MKPTLQAVQGEPAGGICSIEFAALSRIRYIYLDITGNFVAVPTGNPSDFFTDWGSLQISHQGAVPEGDFCSISSLGLLHRLNVMGKGGILEVNTGVGASAFHVYLKFPFDLNEFLHGTPHGNILPMGPNDKLRFRLPTYGGTAGATDLENIRFQVGVRYGNGSFRYLPVLTDDSDAASTNQVESIPDDLMMLLFPTPAAGGATLMVGVKEGTNGILDMVDYQVLLADTISNYNVLEVVLWDMGAMEFWQGQDLTGALGRNLSLNLRAGVGAVSWGTISQQFSPYLNKLSSITEGIVSSQDITKQTVDGVSSDQLALASPAVAFQSAMTGGGNNAKAVRTRAAISRKKAKSSLVGSILRGKVN